MTEEQNTTEEQEGAPETTQEDNEEILSEPSIVEEHNSHLGPILGVLLIVLVLILGGLYLWGATLSEDLVVEEPRVIENNEPETPRAEADTQILQTVSSSDSIDAIEADINSTDLDALDAELLEIENELNAALGNI